MEDGGRSEGESGSTARVGGSEDWRAGASLRRPADVAMMQAADFGNRDDRAEFRRLNWPSVGCVLVERKVSASLVVVRKVAGEGAA